MNLRSLVAILLASPILITAVKSQTTPKSQERPLSQFAWIQGEWEAVGATRSVVESWSRDSSGAWIGRSLVVQGNDTTLSGMKRIEADSAGILFVTDIKATKQEVSFRFVHNDSTGACFLNAKLDFPTTICYRPAGRDSLYFWMEGPGKGVTQRQGYRFGRVR